MLSRSTVQVRIIYAESNGNVSCFIIAYVLFNDSMNAK